MQTGIAVHDPDQKQGITMNSNPNRGSSRKEKLMSATIRIAAVAVLVTLCLATAAGVGNVSPVPSGPRTEFVGRLDNGTGVYPGRRPPTHFGAHAPKTENVLMVGEPGWKSDRPRIQCQVSVASTLGRRGNDSSRGLTQGERS